MLGGNISSEKIDLLVYGPNKPIVENGFSDQFVLHSFETQADLERLSPAVEGKIRGAAVTYNSVRGDKATLCAVPEARDRRQLWRRLRSHRCQPCARAQHRRHQHAGRPDRRGRGHRHGSSDRDPARVRQGRPLSALRALEDAEFPLSVGSLRDRKVGMVGMGRHRPGDRTPARCRRGSGGLSFAQPGRGRLATSTIPT